MIVQSRYQGRSAILNGLNQARVGFATNLLREPAFFRGELKDPLTLREALASLHAVVVSDFKYRPRDRLAFMAWLEEQDLDSDEATEALLDALPNLAPVQSAQPTT